MCGRCACTLDPDSLSGACEYRDTTGKRRKSVWTESELKYVPSFNMGPRDVLPCLVAGSHFGNQNEKVLCPMMWGMIPPWHEGDYRKHTMSTHNARLEGINNSKLYSPPLHRGQRCIVVCEGYYEWKAGKTKKDVKQPYYIYAAQDKGVKADDPKTWNGEWSEESGWKGFKVIKMAGLFNTFKTTEGKIIYSCTIITREANNVFSWLHHRIPIFLSTEEDSNAWLNKGISVVEAINRLNALTLSEGILNWHTVSTLVNNVLCKSEECRKEKKPKEEKKSGPTGFMASWLKKGSTESAKRKSTANNDVRDENISEDNEKPSKIIKSD
ncbi:hypothetical protein KM043_017482 [Ampulex compressa]|nr:hypothetical protein KM043_017482 [Ampulex compressa]